jgi:hypothetical protein
LGVLMVGTPLLNTLATLRCFERCQSGEDISHNDGRSTA